MNRGRYRIGNVSVSITTLANSISIIEKAARRQDNFQVLVSDFRSICYASDNENYRQIVERGLLNVPDGMPLIWMSRLWGLKNVSRTSGPELFVSLLSNPDNGLKHYLIGDTDEVLEEIISKYRNTFGSKIAGKHSPPFLEVEAFDYKGIAKLINESDADLVWISMTAPKQDYFAAQIEPLVNGKVLLGVGAAFRYSIGKYNLPGPFLQKIGLSGLFIRKITFWQLNWYITHTVRLVLFSIQIIYKRIRGRKYFD